MTAQDLKNSILQLAVQGKLVPQDPNDEPASELLKRICAEKEQLVKEGKIKKGKPLPNVTDDEIPFDIPDGWKWVRLGNCGTLYSGFAFKSIDYTQIGIQVVRISDLDEDVISEKDAVYYPENTNLEQYLIVRNSILICLTGSIGKMALVQDEKQRYLNQRVGMFVSYETTITPFVWLFLHSPYVISQWLAAKTSTNGNIKNSNITELLCPLPPLAEQERIVARIEELMPMVEEYGKAQKQLQALNTEFPDKLRKSILQQAVQGKLTERDSADEPASELLKRIKAEKEKLIKEGKIKKEKPLPEITDDEKPFDIPDTWEWVRLGSVTSVRGGKRMPKGKELVTTPTDHIYVRVTDMQNGTILANDLHYVPDDVYPKIKEYIINKEDVYLVIVGSTIGKTGLVPDMFDGMNLTENAVKLIPTLIEKTYLYTILSTDFVLSQMMSRVKQEGQPKLAIERLRTTLIPLPPIAEQKRIVERVNELLAMCDELK